MVTFASLKLGINLKSNHPSQSLLATWQKTYGLKLVDSDRFHANIGIVSKDLNMNWPPMSTGTLASLSIFDLPAFIADMF